MALDGNPKSIPTAERVVMPGVGAFGDCMNELRRRELIQPILDYVATGASGPRHLRRHADDDADRRGVRRAHGPRPGARPRARHSRRPRTTAVRTRFRTSAGIRCVKPNNGPDWSGTILEGVAPGTTCYFVHSFTAEPEDERYRLADCDYNGRRISAALRVGNVFGTQFHPEKSGETGLRILRNFLALGRVKPPAQPV